MVRCSNPGREKRYSFSSTSRLVLQPAPPLWETEFFHGGRGMRLHMSKWERKGTNFTLQKYSTWSTLRIIWFISVVFINHNWTNQLSNTTVWWLDICCLLHRYQLYVSALMSIFRLIDWQQTCKQLYFDIRLVYGGGGLGLEWGTRSHVCWVGSVMWMHGYYCAGLRQAQ
jgi:hypothetical protein